MLTIIDKEIKKVNIKGNASFLPDGFLYVIGYDKQNKISVKMIGQWIKEKFYVKSIIFTKKGKE